MSRPEELDIDTIIGQYLSEGMEPSEIAKLHGCATSSVYAALQRNGIPVREKGRLVKPVENLDTLVEDYYSSPDPLAVICARHGTSTSRLYQEIGFRGLSIRRRRRRRSPAQMVPREVKEVLADGLDD